MKVTRLSNGQTMTSYSRREKLLVDCGRVSDAVNRNPGVSKREVSEDTGLEEKRVCRCIKAIQRNEVDFKRLDYGYGLVRDGRYSGTTRWGWFPLRLARYQNVMVVADRHSSKVMRGVHDSRLLRLAFAKGLTTRAALEAIRQIELRLEVDVEKLSETDLEAFEALLEEELEQEAE